MSITFKSRIKASLIHFVLSAIFFLSLIITIIFFWFPSPFFLASGGWQGLKLVTLVDLVLGPLLTFILFNIKKTKAALLTDLSLIAILQLSALVWGIHNIHQQRPLAVVFWEHSFYTVPAKSFEKQKFNLKEYGHSSPVYIYAQKPETVEGLKIMSTRIRKFQRPPHQHVELYQPLKRNYSKIYKSEVNIDEIIQTNQSMKKQLDKILSDSKTSQSDNHYISLVSRYHNIIIIFSKTNNILGFLKAPHKN